MGWVWAGNSVHWHKALQFLVFPLNAGPLLTPVVGSVPAEVGAFCPARHNKAGFACACGVPGPWGAEERGCCLNSAAPGSAVGSRMGLGVGSGVGSGMGYLLPLPWLQLFSQSNLGALQWRAEHGEPWSRAGCTQAGEIPRSFPGDAPKSLRGGDF